MSTTPKIQAPQFKQMGLSECGIYDHENGLKAKLTGWGIICKDRHEKGISKKQRRLKGQS